MSRGRGEDFAGRMLDWYDRYGRKDLPWQRAPTAYRVWVSEVMLQQTQVATVIPYFERFIKVFPTVAALARADEDEVLGYWSGLGYYARGRNLHAAARQVVAEHGGQLPTDLDSLMALPGVGRSTAGAVLALAWGQRHAILDGNVKRVLARYHRIGGWPGQGEPLRRLWAIAETHTPDTRVADYTQAMMDLGALVCTRIEPRCDACPLAGGCAARATGTQTEYPAPRPRRRLPERHALMLVVRDSAGDILLQRRPPTGVWGGLWSLPECPEGEEPVAWCRCVFGLQVRIGRALERFSHTFTHFRLQIAPLLLECEGSPNTISDPGSRIWFRPGKPARLGIPAPVQKLLTTLTVQTKER